MLRTPHGTVSCMHLLFRSERRPSAAHTLALVAALTVSSAITQPAAAASAPSKSIFTKAVSTTVRDALKGSVVVQSYRLGKFNGSMRLSIASKDTYRVLTDAREAVSIGDVSYERIAAELSGDDLKKVNEAHPGAEWYLSTAYPDLLSETLGFVFDDLDFAVARGSSWKTSSANGSKTYRFNVSGAKALSDGEPWYGVTRSTSVAVQVTIDAKGRITAMSFTGPSKREANTASIKFTYKAQTVTAPDTSKVIGWEELVRTVPSLAPLDPTVWEVATGLSEACVTALGPVRALEEKHPSGLNVSGNDIDVLNEGLAAARSMCSKEEFLEWYEREFIGWINGGAKITA